MLISFVMHTLGISYGRLAQFHSYSLEQFYMVYNCLRARHIACLTIVHQICAKVQIIDNFSRISSSKMILTFIRCHLSSGITDSKINVHDFYKVFYFCVHIFRGSNSTTWML